jgi:hypothetical protein
MFRCQSYASQRHFLRRYQRLQPCQLPTKHYLQPLRPHCHPFRASFWDRVLQGLFILRQVQRELIVAAILLLFVDKRTLVSWLTWVPPRFGNDSSIVTQFERALSESFAIALRQSGNLASSNQPYRVGHPLWGVRPMHAASTPSNGASIYFPALG